jgi:UDP-N-acetyl-D-glucosamine dehydrogenase
MVSYHDPYIPNVKTNEGHVFESIELTKELLSNADCVVLTTNHKDLDLVFIEEHSKMIVDMRNMIKESNGKVVKL